MQPKTKKRSWIGRAVIALGMALCVGIGVVGPAMLAAPAPAFANTQTTQDEAPNQGSALDSLAEIFTFALNVFTPLTALQVGMIGWLMSNEFILGNTSQNSDDFTMSKLLQHMWMTVRNLVNYTLVLVLLAIAAWSVFGSFQEGGEFSPVRTLGKVAIGAVAVNFTWFAGIVVLDASQIAANIVFGLPKEVVNAIDQSVIIGIDDEGNNVTLGEFFTQCIALKDGEVTELLKRSSGDSEAKVVEGIIKQASKNKNIPCGKNSASDNDIETFDNIDAVRFGKDQLCTLYKTVHGNATYEAMIDDGRLVGCNKNGQYIGATGDNSDNDISYLTEKNLCNLWRQAKKNDADAEEIKLESHQNNCAFTVDDVRFLATGDTSFRQITNTDDASENTDEPAMMSEQYKPCTPQEKRRTGCTKVTYTGFISFTAHSFNWDDFNVGTIGQLFAYPILKIHSLPKSSTITQSWKDLTIQTLFAIIVVLVLIVVFTALLLVLLERVFILWLNLILSPVGVLIFMVRDIVEIDADNEMLGWKAFVSAAFLPVTVSLPMVFGFMLIITGGKVKFCKDGASDATGVVDTCAVSGFSKILPQVSDIQELFWYIFAIGCLWYSAQLAEDNAKIVKGAISGMNEMVKTGAGFVASLPTYAPMIPVKGKDGKETNISLAGMTQGMNLIKGSFEERSRKEIQDLFDTKGNLSEQLNDHSDKGSYEDAANLRINDSQLQELRRQIEESGKIPTSMLQSFGASDKLIKDMTTDHVYARSVVARLVHNEDKTTFHQLENKIKNLSFDTEAPEPDKQ